MFSHDGTEGFSRSHKRGVLSLRVLILIGHVTGDVILDHWLEWFLLDFPSKIP